MFCCFFSDKASRSFVRPFPYPSYVSCTTLMYDSMGDKSTQHSAASCDAVRMRMTLRRRMDMMRNQRQPHPLSGVVCTCGLFLPSRGGFPMEFGGLVPVILRLLFKGASGGFLREVGGLVPGVPSGLPRGVQVPFRPHHGGHFSN